MANKLEGGRKITFSSYTIQLNVETERVFIRSFPMWYEFQSFFLRTYDKFLCFTVFLCTNTVVSRALASYFSNAFRTTFLDF